MAILRMLPEGPLPALPAAFLVAMALPALGADFAEIAAIDAGGHHTCAVTTGGGVKCWGANDHGQLGDGTTTNRSTPTAVVGLGSGVAVVSAGGGFTCALTNAGGVKCWGSNDFGQLGNGSQAGSPVPVDVTGLASGVASIATGGSHACVVTTGGAVKCWGDNSFGPKLGVTGVDYSPTPVSVPALPGGVAGIAAGLFHSCARISGGGAQCWGGNWDGQLGDNSPMWTPQQPPLFRATPGDVLGLTSGVSAIAQTYSHSCAVITGGGLKCWGYNFFGQLGDDSRTNRAAPVPVAGLTSGIAAVAPGFTHTCARTTTGAAKCWGNNDSGQLGNGSTLTSLVPGDVTGLGSAVVSITAGESHSCALLDTGTARCWGLNSSGQLGDGTLAARTLPVAVVAPPASTPSVPVLAPASDTGASSSDGITKVTLPSFSGTCFTGETVTLRVDGNPVSPTDLCVAGTWGITLTAQLSDGAHAITAFATGPGGDSAPSAALAMLVDTTAPSVSFSCSPPASNADSGATFCFTSDDGAGSGVASYECSLDSGPFAPCTSPRSITSLAVGSHGFAVRATDLAGNTSVVPASFGWTVAVDTTPDAFSFPSRTGILPNTFVASTAIVVSGTNSPSAISVANGSYSIGCTGTFTADPGAVANGQQVCVGHVSGAQDATVTTTLTIGGVTGTFSSTAAALLVAPASLDFGTVFRPGASPAKQVSITNQSAQDLAVGSVTASPGFTVTHDCGTLAGGASCTAGVSFAPVVEGPASGTLTVVAGAETRTVALAGNGTSMVTHYYNAILRRAPDAGGKAFWEGEAARMQALGANVNETWFSMAGSFFASAEYLAFARDDTGFVTDLYNTFFNRAPDAGGLSFWTGQLAAGMPREVALVSFMFSTEFVNFTQAIFGNTAVRREIDTVVDFYRGLLARLPDDGGFGFWVQRFRTAQCQGPSAVYVQAEAISSLFAQSPEYTARARSTSQYVGDLYNAFLRRGGDLTGVQYWISQIATGARTREQVRQQFVASAEFSARVQAIIAQGCLP